jgi:hypothetical protein
VSEAQLRSTIADLRKEIDLLNLEKKRLLEVVMSLQNELRLIAVPADDDTVQRASLENKAASSDNTSRS